MKYGDGRQEKTHPGGSGAQEEKEQEKEKGAGIFFYNPEVIGEDESEEEGMCQGHNFTEVLVCGQKGEKKAGPCGNSFIPEGGNEVEEENQGDKEEENESSSRIHEGGTENFSCRSDEVIIKIRMVEVVDEPVIERINIDDGSDSSILAVFDHIPCDHGFFDHVELVVSERLPVDLIELAFQEQYRDQN